MVPSIARLVRSLGRTSVLLCFALAIWPTAAQQIPEQAQVQMRQQASLLATQPARISVKAANQGIRVGDKSTDSLIRRFHTDSRWLGCKERGLLAHLHLRLFRNLLGSSRPDCQRETEKDAGSSKGTNETRDAGDHGTVPPAK